MKPCMRWLWTVLAVVLVVFAWLSLVGMPAKYEARSTTSIAVFSTPELARAAKDQSFQIASNDHDLQAAVTVVLAGEGSLQPNEVSLRVEVTGRYRIKLFERGRDALEDWPTLPENVRSGLETMVDDEGVQLKELRIGTLVHP